LYPRPRQAAEYAAMAVREAANGFTEELVTRAYLVTRLEGLLKSSAAAVVLAAVAFASYHAHHRADGMVSCMFQGVAWGAAYLYIRRVWPFAFAHALYNVLIELR
jgi:membrane protease YdiL (CAAX protease family)